MIRYLVEVPPDPGAQHRPLIEVDRLLTVTLVTTEAILQFRHFQEESVPVKDVDVRDAIVVLDVNGEGKGYDGEGEEGEKEHAQWGLGIEEGTEVLVEHH